MAEMGYGFGSECHLLRYLGRHRERLNTSIAEAIGATSIRWLDFHFDSSKTWLDGERKGIDFLASNHPASAAWAAFWPQRGNPPNWDAVGAADIDGNVDWLLVEAKAHPAEIMSDCQASEKGGLAAIRDRLDELKSALGVPSDRDWLHRHYQFANRLAVLNFLIGHDVPARLLFIYFVGDKRPDGKWCPASEGEWTAVLAEQANWLGLGDKHALSDRVHKIFLPTIAG